MLLFNQQQVEYYFQLKVEDRNVLAASGTMFAIRGVYTVMSWTQLSEEVAPLNVSPSSYCAWFAQSTFSISEYLKQVMVYDGTTPSFTQLLYFGGKNILSKSVFSGKKTKTIKQTSAIINSA